MKSSMSFFFYKMQSDKDVRVTFVLNIFILSFRRLWGPPRSSNGVVKQNLVAASHAVVKKAGVGIVSYEGD